MSDFTVIEIINAVTIRVTPQWLYKGADGKDVVDDKIKILGLNVLPTDVVVQHRLTSLLLNKEVSLSNPLPLTHNDNPLLAFMMCSVIIDKTDVIYYFPEYKDKNLATIG